MIVLVETWLDVKGWEKWRWRLPRGYKGECRMQKKEIKRQGDGGNADGNKRRNNGEGKRDKCKDGRIDHRKGEYRKGELENDRGVHKENMERKLQELGNWT